MVQRVQTVMTGVAGAPFYNSLYFADGDAAQDCTDAVIAFWTACADIMDPALTITVANEVETYDTATGTATGSVGTSGAQIVCSGIGPALPPTTQALVRLKTPTYAAGRRIQGRIFVPGATEDWSDQGQIASYAGSPIGVAAVALVSDTATQLSIWSRANGTSALVTVVDVWTQFSVLRSRRD